MVWGCFSWLGMGPLFILDGAVAGVTSAELLELHVYPHFARYDRQRRRVLFLVRQRTTAQQQRGSCNAVIPRHSCLAMAPNSSDLNPIENLLPVLKLRLRKRRPGPRTIHDLRQAIEAEWATLTATPDHWRLFIERMQARITAVLEARGFPTIF